MQKMKKMRKTISIKQLDEFNKTAEEHEPDLNESAI